MTELAPNDQPPYDNYPFMFGGHALPEEYQDIHAANLAFAEQMVLPDDPTYIPDEFDYLTVQTCATALTSADYRLGRDTGSLGTMANDHEDGVWQFYAMPTFYHNGDGTRLAMLGTKAYMDYINQLEGDRSPYANRRTYQTTMLTAAYDDLVFGAHGRGGDEQQSAALASMHLRMQGFPSEVVNDVVIGVEASVFNEQTLMQNYDPARGAEPVQRGSLVGDLWAAGTAQGTMNTFLLTIENLWKRDLVDAFGQVLRTGALNEAISRFDWECSAYTDLLSLAQRHPLVVNTFGDMFIGNHKFLLAKNRFADPRITELMRPALGQNAQLQKRLGYAIKNRWLSITEAFHCAASYADGRAWQQGQRPTAALGTDIVYSPERISGLLLASHSIEDIQNPVPANEFYEAFMAERRGDQ